MTTKIYETDRLYVRPFTKEESHRLQEDGLRFKISDALQSQFEFEYKSNTNSDWLTIEKIKEMINETF